MACYWDSSITLVLHYYKRLVHPIKSSGGHSVRLVSQSSDHLPLPTVEGLQATFSTTPNGRVSLACLD
ncbi:unnamed protein product, partial [Sphenostylis stenocarpa]